MTERQEFPDWFYREHCSTPERRRQYASTGIQELLRKAYESGQKNGGGLSRDNDANLDQAS